MPKSWIFRSRWLAWRRKWKGKFAKLEEEFQEKSSRLEEQLAKLKEKLARKDELFQQTKVELTKDAVEAYTAGFEDAMTQVACVHPGVDLSLTG